MILHLAGLAAANACFLAAGIGLGRGLGLWRSPGEIPGRIALLYMIGLAAAGVAATWALLAGLSLAPWEVIAGCALIAAAGMLLPAPGVPLLPRGRPVTAEGWPVIAVAGAVVAISALLVVDALYRPLAEWDAWAMWTMKARAIVLLGGLDPHMFASPGYRLLHLDYPLLLPGLEAIDFRFMGALDTQVVHVQPALLMVALLFSLPPLLRDRVPAALVWPGVLLLAVAPRVTSQAGSALADVPVAVFFAMAAVWAWRWLGDRRPQTLALCALFAAAALSTKREGGPFVVALFVVLAVAAGRTRRRSAVLAGVGAIAVAIPWQLWLHANGVNTKNGEIPYAKMLDAGYLIGRLGRIPHGAEALVSRSVRPQDWLVIVPVAAVAAVVAARREGRGTAAFVAAVAALVLMSVGWAYWIGRPSLHYYIASSASRVVTTPVVLLGALLPVLVAGGPLRPRPGEGPSAAPADSRPAGTRPEGPPEPAGPTIQAMASDVLVTPAFVHEHLRDIRVLDVRGRVLPDEPRYHADPGAYRDGHIPGAAFVDWRRDFTDRDDPVPVQLAPPEMFASDATRLGIRNDSVVVAYDDYRNVLAGRVVWALRAYGHRRAHVLDGGLQAWVGAGHELREGDEPPTPADPPYRAGERGETLWGLAEMRAALDRDVLILDARPHAEYAGIESHARRHGHVPGAVNVPYRSLLEDDGPFRRPDVLRQVFADAGVDVARIDRPVVVYCNGGVSATAVATALALAGGPAAAVYDGSWNEWGNRSDTPIEN